jgi:cellulose synthase (UDP-forming)
MDGALRRFAGRVHAAVAPVAERVPDPALRTALSRALASQAARHAELQPYTFHVSEDIYTSVLLHGDEARRWRSVFHPTVLTRMLSPQDPLAWTIQRFKYASGTLDIGLRDNPLRRRGLDAWQKLMYGATIYAYLAPLWTLPLMVAPIVYLLFGVAPVRAYDGALWAHLLPFLVASRLALWVGTWGVPTRRSEQYHLAAFWLNLRALFHVLARRPLRFAVTPKARAARRAVRLAAPHLFLLAAMAIAIVVGTVRLDEAAPGAIGAWAANAFWTLHNGASLLPFVVAVLWPRPRREVTA